MNRHILLIFTFLAALAASAQNERLHVFRPEGFATYKADGLKIEYYGPDNSDSGFTTLSITDPSGKTTTLDMADIDSVQVRTFDIPEIFVTLSDHPEWTELQGRKDDVHPATLYMNGNGMYPDLPEQTVEFRGRGNSTWNKPKKPYRFKMQKKASVCSLPKAKTFALLANYIDCSLMRNAVSLWVARYLQMPYTNHCIPVKVNFNGIYKGQYVITEKIGIGGGSVDIDETKGILFELDANYDETYKFMYSWRSGYFEKKIPVMVKDPDFDELAAEAASSGISDPQAYFDLWREDFTRMADAVTQRSPEESLSDVIDIDAAVNFMFVNALAGNQELAHPKSFFMYKESLEPGEVYHFGPVWDFDWAYTFAGKEGAPHTVLVAEGDGSYNGGTFLRCLYANEEFRTKFKEKLDRFMTDGYPQLKTFIEEYAAIIEPSAKENGLLWPDSGNITGSWEFRRNLDILKSWIDSRLNFMLTHKNFGLY